MLHPTITTRPERTTDQIAADRKAANAFFARFDDNRLFRTRNRQRLIAYFSNDWNLICCDIEAREWARKQIGNQNNRSTLRATIREAKEAAQAALTPTPLELNKRALRSYVPITTRVKMPAHRTTRPLSPRETLPRSAATFYRDCDNPDSRVRRKLNAERIPFVQWLAAHPHYGPASEAPAVQNTPRQYRFNRYQKGDIRPAGTTYQRALQIAIAAQETAG